MPGQHLHCQKGRNTCVDKADSRKRASSQGKDGKVSHQLPGRSH